jgi:hypothetical protein
MAEKEKTVKRTAIKFRKSKPGTKGNTTQKAPVELRIRGSFPPIAPGVWVLLSLYGLAGHFFYSKKGLAQV